MVRAGWRSVMDRAGGSGVVDGTRRVVSRGGRVRMMLGVVFLVSPTGGGKEQVRLGHLRRRSFGLNFWAGMSNRWRGRLERGG